MTFEKALRRLERELVRPDGYRLRRAAACEKLLKRQVEEMIKWAYVVGTKCPGEGATVRALHEVSRAIYNDNEEAIVDFLTMIHKDKNKNDLTGTA